jgi:hypothetical protein
MVRWIGVAIGEAVSTPYGAGGFEVIIEVETIRTVAFGAWILSPRLELVDGKQIPPPSRHLIPKPFLQLVALVSGSRCHLAPPFPPLWRAIFRERNRQ